MRKENVRWALLSCVASSLASHSHTAAIASVSFACGTFEEHKLGGAEAACLSCVSGWKGASEWAASGYEYKSALITHNSRTNI